MPMTHSSPANTPRSDGASDSVRATCRPAAATPPAAPQHWLSLALVARSSDAWGALQLSPCVIDVEGEIAFWNRHYQSTAAWHRGVLPFAHYVPALRFGISLFLQCHDYDLTAIDEEQLAARYARVRRDSRVEWHEARKVLQAAYLRLHARWQAQPPLRPQPEHETRQYRPPRPGGRRRPSPTRRID